MWALSLVERTRHSGKRKLGGGITQPRSLFYNNSRFHVCMNMKKLIKTNTPLVVVGARGEAGFAPCSLPHVHGAVVGTSEGAPSSLVGLTPIQM